MLVIALRLMIVVVLGMQLAAQIQHGEIQMIIALHALQAIQQIHAIQMLQTALAQLDIVAVRVAGVVKLLALWGLEMTVAELMLFVRLGWSVMMTIHVGIVLVRAVLLVIVVQVSFALMANVALLVTKKQVMVAALAEHLIQHQEHVMIVRPGHLVALMDVMNLVQ
jgi:hypothetical protein